MPTICRFKIVQFTRLSYITFTRLCRHHHHPKKKPVPTSSHSPVPPAPLALGSHSSIFCLSKSVLDVSYKWNPIKCDPLWLASSACTMFPRWTCVAAWITSSFLLWPNRRSRVNIPHLFARHLINTWVVSTFWLLWILLYHSSTNFCVDIGFSFFWLYTEEWNCCLTW